MNMLVRVKNNVTTSPTLAGRADNGMMKLRLEANTIKMHGK